MTMTIPTKEELASMSDERIRRKAYQHWDMAGLARQDHDHVDERKHAEIAKAYDSEARRRAVS